MGREEGSMGINTSVRQINVDELPNLIPLAEEFCGHSEFFQEFNPTAFVETWTHLLESGLGAVFVLNDFEGALGAFKCWNALDGSWIAIGMFWYVSPLKGRGKGVALLKAFEEWAKTEGCTKVSMAHLADVNSVKMQHLYQKRGYKLMEQHFVKEV
jgi:GNAT superfamily N-acetyltransferase